MRALDVAGQIINYCVSIDKPITNLHLQKLLYFVDIYYLINKKVRLIEENFEAWQYGPVIPNVYYEYSIFAAYPIGIIVKNIESFPKDFEGKLYGFIDKLANMLAWDLVKISHEENQPWYKTYHKYGEKSVIPNDLLKEYADEQRQILSK